MATTSTPAYCLAAGVARPSPARGVSLAVRSPALGRSPSLARHSASSGANTLFPHTQRRHSGPGVVCAAKKDENAEKDKSAASAIQESSPLTPTIDHDDSSRREVVLLSSSVALLALFNFSGDRPSYLGVQSNPPSLALCPSAPACISTSEELNDPAHYVPPWTYNPEDGRGRKNPATQEKAMEELVTVVSNTKPDNYEATIKERTKDYLYVEYRSPFFGFVDDVEFWFPPGNRSLVEYRSASRVGKGDFDVNRKRIRTLRKALEKYGWESVGY